LLDPQLLSNTQPPGVTFTRKVDDFALFPPGEAHGRSTPRPSAEFARKNPAAGSSVLPSVLALATLTRPPCRPTRVAATVHCRECDPAACSWLFPRAWGLKPDERATRFAEANYARLQAVRFTAHA